MQIELHNVVFNTHWTSFTQDQDPNEQVDPDWIETSQDAEVLALANKCPENLKNVKEEEVAFITLIYIFD